MEMRIPTKHPECRGAGSGTHCSQSIRPVAPPEECSRPRPLAVAHSAPGAWSCLAIEWLSNCPVQANQPDNPPGQREPHPLCHQQSIGHSHYLWAALRSTATRQDTASSLLVRLSIRREPGTQTYLRVSLHRLREHPCRNKSTHYLNQRTLAPRPHLLPMVDPAAKAATCRSPACQA